MSTDKTSLENENQPSCLGVVSGSFLSNLEYRMNEILYQGIYTIGDIIEELKT